MSDKSGAFLTKSIILLVIFLVCIGSSMWLGKQLGRRIMDTTRINIEEKFPQQEIADENNNFVLDLVSGERSSFGFDDSSFAPARFNEEWADPSDEELEDSGEEGPTVTVTPLDPDDPEAVSGDQEGEGSTGTDGDGEGNGGDEGGPGIFELGDSTTYRIQVGTYTDKYNAEGVWNDLTSAAYNASISTFTSEDDKTMYRVTVGFYHTLEEANKVAEDLRKLGFNGWVQPVEVQ